MASPFETVILNMRDMGMFQFLLPFMMTAAVFYGLLRKSQVLGEPKSSVAVNATVAMVAAFMVWASPIILGIDIEAHLTSFFVQGMSVMLVVMVGLLIISMAAPPNLPESLKGIFSDPKVGKALVYGIIIVIGIVAISSGFLNVFFPSGGGSAGGGINLPSLSEDSIIVLGTFLFIIIFMLVLASLG